MNVILFLFPTEVAIELTKRVLTRLEIYNGFQDSSKLRLTFRINLSLLLIKNECYSEALELLTTTLEESRWIMPYQTLAVCFARMAICYFKLGQGMEMEFMQKTQQLLQLYEDQNLWINVQDEYFRYCYG